MGLLDRLDAIKEKGLSAVAGGGSTQHAVAPGGQGIGGGPQAPIARNRWWDDSDGTGKVNVILRTLQTFFAFVNLCIFISLASFQAKHDVGPSFLSGLGLFITSLALLQGGIFLATPLLFDRVTFLHGLHRGLRQVRFGFILNGLQVFLNLLLALIVTISANVAGCKDATKDPHAELEGYVDALPGFCRNKRAGAAFFWLNFIAWAVTFFIVFMQWRTLRHHPSSGPFRPPGGAAFPNSHEEEEEEEAFHAGEEDPERGYRPSGDYYRGGERVFGERAPPGYDSSAPQGGQRLDGVLYDREEEYTRTGQRDPFDDRNQASQQAYHAEAEQEDPYQAIRRSMEVGYQGRRGGY